jgi:hypothetical protein
MAMGYDDDGDGATGERTNKRANKQRTNKQTNKRTNERTNIRTNKQTIEQMNKQMSTNQASSYTQQSNDQAWVDDFGAANECDARDKNKIATIGTRRRSRRLRRGQERVNNQPCGRMYFRRRGDGVISPMYFRRRGDGVISTTMTMSNITRMRQDEDKENN